MYMIDASYTYLVNVEAHEGLVLLGELVAERGLVLGPQRRLLVAEHALAYEPHLKHANV